MNSVDMATNLINRAKNLQEFTVEVELTEAIAFNGVVPFDMTIKDGVLSAKIFALDFDEAVQTLSNYLGNE